MKTELTEEDRNKVWRLATSTWLHFAWENGQWMTYPCDPRTNPFLTNKHPAKLRPDGSLIRRDGFVEA